MEWTLSVSFYVDYFEKEVQDRENNCHQMLYGYELIDHCVVDWWELFDHCELLDRCELVLDQYDHLVE